jgi:uncharacterized protein (DUF2141 family)
MQAFIASLLALALVASGGAYAQNAHVDSALTVRATGFEDGEGQALLLLFRASDKVPKSPFLTMHAPIVRNTALFTVPHPGYGEFAAIVVHDRNSNNEIDHRWGLPSEPLGFSNHWQLTLFSGMPSFEKLHFVYSRTQRRIEVHMDD